MIIQEEVDRLLEWKPGKDLVTSLYLNTDPRRFTGGEYLKVLKERFKAQREVLDSGGHTKEQLRNVLEDWSRIEEHVSLHFRNNEKPGLAVFASHGAGLFQAYPLPRAVPDALIVDAAPYVDPLLVLADEFERFCAVIVDRRRGRIFDIFMGEIQEVADIVDEVPSRVRRLGHQMKAETGVMRHIGEHYRAHYKNVADETFLAFKRRRFDWLLVGGPAPDIPEFEKVLHSYLQPRIAGRLSVSVSDDSTAQEVLRQAREVEQRLASEQESKLVQKLLTQVHSGKLGTVGLADMLRALRNGQVHTLVVKDGLRAEGLYCKSCRYIGLGERTCPNCQSPLQASPDVIDLAVAEAIRQGCEVRHVFEATQLDGVGSVGALLRFRV